MSEITLPRSPSSSPPHFFPFFQRIHSSLSLSLFFLFFFPPPCAKLWPTFIKNFLLVEPRWSRFLCSVSIDIEPTIQSGTKRSESAAWRERRGRRILHRRNRFFFFLFSLSSRQAGAIKGFCLSDWRCKCGFDGKFLMAGQRQWECWSVACWNRGWENK